MNVSDIVAELLVQLSLTKVHGLMGGGAAGLNDGFICNSNIDYLCYHNEQSAGYAALAEARLKKRWAILNPTTGCGGTNAYTPVLNAWQDSIPLVVISGNVNLNTCTQYIQDGEDFELRAYGVQENDIEKCVKPITKFTSTLWAASDLEDTFLKAFSLANSGRKGPVWIDIPADIQHQQIPNTSSQFIPKLAKKILNGENRLKFKKSDQSKKGFQLLKILEKSERPLLLVGGGVRNNKHAVDLVRELVNETKIPVVATYAGTDVISHDYKRYLGAIGIKGNRAANFAVQNCDCLLVLGSRLAFGAVGYDMKNFAKHAKILVIDNDLNEIKKNEKIFKDNVKQLNIDIGEFLMKSNVKLSGISSDWTKKCEETKIKWEIINENKAVYNYKGISIYHVMEELRNGCYDGCNFAIDAGSISYVGPTSLHYRNSRNFIFSPAQADMGCALPSALGVSSNSSQKTFCITGDGSFMSNIQELATLSYHRYNLTVVLLSNDGYLSISNTQKNNYGENRVYGEHRQRGLEFPDFNKICEAFDIEYTCIDKVQNLHKLCETGPRVIEIKCLIDEIISPYQSRLNGEQAGAHDMAPHKEISELEKYASTKLFFIR